MHGISSAFLSRKLQSRNEKKGVYHGPEGAADMFVQLIASNSKLLRHINGYKLSKNYFTCTVSEQEVIVKEITISKKRPENKSSSLNNKNI